MPKKPRPEPDDPEQSKRFVDVARDLESDESGNSFEQALAIVKPDRSRGQLSSVGKAKKPKP